MKLNWKIATLVAIGIAFVIALVSTVYFHSDLRMFSLLNGFAAFTALSIPVYVKYTEHTRMSRIENEFPRFVEDFTNNISVGMPLPAALAETARNDYGELTRYVQEMSAKLEWGIPFDKILINFGHETGSALIARTVKGIIQAHDSGGKISEVMMSMASAVRELDKVKKERTASVFSQMITGYFIFFVFVGIMVVMSSFLIPFLSAGSDAAAKLEIQRQYQNIFLSLVLVQGIFAGLGVGKMAEGNVTAGLKHSFVMAIVGYTVLAVF